MPTKPAAAPPITPAQAFSIACLNDLSGAAASVNAPLCTLPTTPAAPARPANPAPGPAAYAVRFWRTIPLPVPKPAIPPGYAITGKTAYLVTHGTTSPPEYVDNTPLGQLTIRVSGAYVVDWGDANSPYWDGPYAFEGQPWPDGRITHTFEVAGTYTVTVEEDWTAVWQLAGVTGTLGGLRTTATIPGFQARQYQAVITN